MQNYAVKCISQNKNDEIVEYEYKCGCEYLCECLCEFDCNCERFHNYEKRIKPDNSCIYTFNENFDMLMNVDDVNDVNDFNSLDDFLEQLDKEYDDEMYLLNNEVNMIF